MKGQEVYVVGAGNSAGQAAIHLAKYAARVTLLVRGAALAAAMSDYLIRAIQITDNIDVRHRSVKRVASAVGGGSIAISFVHQYLSGR